MTLKLRIFVLVCSLFFTACPKKPPREDCYYGYFFTGTVKDAGNNPLVAVEVRNSYSASLTNEPITTTDVNGVYSVFAPSYLNRELETINFRKAGFQDNVSTALTAGEVNSACNIKVNIIRNVVLSP